jgi:HRDC domain/RQC domain
LETMLAFGKAYGQTYTAQFLTADRYLLLRQPDHRLIATHGRLRNRSKEDVIATMHYLVDQGFITVNGPECMTVEVSLEGREWLANPQEMMVMKRQVRFSQLEKLLRDALRDFRKQAAESNQLKPWEVVTDYTMDRIVLSKPLDLDALSRVPGCNTLKCERFGTGLVKTVQDVLEHYEDFWLAALLVKIKSGSYPKVKALFLENLTLPEIAQACNLQLGTVCHYLRNLHYANAVDLVPWIERNLNSKALFRGVEYFERVSRASLKEANLVLGLDFNTLQFCLLYARDKRMQRQEARLLAS